MATNEAVINKTKKSSLAKRSWNKMLRNKLAMIGLIIFVIMVLASVLAPLLTSYNPSTVDMDSITLAPSREHLLGTDKLGRDVFARILYGGRVSVYVSICGALVGTLIGTILGGIAGYFGGKIDKFLVRLSEVFLTFPNMILILILVGIVGQGVNNLIIIFSLTGWMTTFRMVRNEFLSLREETYVEVCKAFGISEVSIMFKHILPNTLSPIMVSTTLNIAGYILQEAGLSFLGLGVPSTIPTWGNIMNAAKSVEVLKNYWWLWLSPGLVISIFVLAINYLGDGLRDVLDPKQ
ncbi:oligopeptide ABC transporter permease [Anaerosalibacter sp. Marseille-P3206]|uniref:oligopeptide ABC transporter permease n=1 Tax=Anaerosalibacter sp. Marseille-P3206 TaxID=1871005 RepID=UPI0009843199|nr:oligopeptide ABC transporter permease [Anaerosalibacter sp. Marseille-P3206]